MVIWPNGPSFVTAFRWKTDLKGINSHHQQSPILYFSVLTWKPLLMHNKVGSFSLLPLLLTLSQPGLGAQCTQPGLGAQCTPPHVHFLKIYITRTPSVTDLKLSDSLHDGIFRRKYWISTASTHPWLPRQCPNWCMFLNNIIQQFSCKSSPEFGAFLQIGSCIILFLMMALKPMQKLQWRVS